MKKSTKILLLLLLGVVFACGLSIWAEYSPAVYDYRLIHNRDMHNGNPREVFLLAFATALRINHPEAYDMIDPRAKPQLDEWMNTHQIQRCENIPDVTLIESGTETGSKVTLGCYGYDGWINFVVDNIITINMKVLVWGDVR